MVCDISPAFFGEIFAKNSWTHFAHHVGEQGNTKVALGPGARTRRSDSVSPKSTVSCTKGSPSFTNFPLFFPMKQSRVQNDLKNDDARVSHLLWGGPS